MSIEMNWQTKILKSGYSLRLSTSKEHGLTCCRAKLFRLRRKVGDCRTTNGLMAAIRGALHDAINNDWPHLDQLV